MQRALGMPGATPGRVTSLALVLFTLLVMAGGARAAEPGTVSKAGAAPKTGPASNSRAAADPLDEEAEPPQVWDPFEKANRRTFRMNNAVDRWFWSPLTGAYQFVVPGCGRRALRRAIVNLESPALFVNNVLQLAPLDALITLQRFGINTTIGLAGLFDPATRLGLPGSHTDFGQTLAIYGVSSGPYLILPVLGPTTVRDGSGYVVDFMFQPTTYFLPGFTLFIYAAIHQGGAGLAAREAHAGELQALEASSVDFYAALRSAYYQNRVASIAERKEDHGPRAFARLLGLLPFRAAGGQVGDAASQHGGQTGKPVALEH
jgi:phospholipid-binding lipoprotein MlaA